MNAIPKDDELGKGGIIEFETIHTTFICSTLNSCYEYLPTESCPEAKDSGRRVNREESSVDPYVIKSSISSVCWSPLIMD